MDHPKTYFILPTTVYRPGDLIELGQVITDPRLPYARLAPPLVLEGALIPRTSSTVEWSARNVRTNDLSVGAFSHIVNIIAAGASGSKHHNEVLTWEAALLETQFIELSEDPHYVERSVKVEAVENWLKKNRWLARTAYMITGLKIAMNPGKVTHSSNDVSDIAAKLRATVDLQGAVNAGAEVSYDNSTGIAGGGKPGTAYVFAYRLQKIYVSWRNKLSWEYVEGGDLHGLSQEGTEQNDVEISEDEEVEETEPILEPGLEIDEALFEVDDFGSSLPAYNMEVQEVTKDNGHYLLIYPKN